MNATSPNLSQHVTYTHKTGKPAIRCTYTTKKFTQHNQNCENQIRKVTK